MAEVNVEQTDSQGNLFLPVSDVMLSEVIDQAPELGRRYPGSWSRISCELRCPVT